VNHTTLVVFVALAAVSASLAAGVYATSTQVAFADSTNLKQEDKQKAKCLALVISRADACNQDARNEFNVDEPEKMATTTTNLLVRKVCVDLLGRPCNPVPFSIQITGNNPQPSTFTLTPDSSQLVTLGPGTFTMFERATFTIVSATFSGDCMKTAPTEATGTISVGQHLTCTITNTIIQD
jgi:hypothetical protein